MSDDNGQAVSGRFAALNDPEFVKRAVSGDREAFGRLFGTLVGPLAEFIARLGIGPDDAEEIAADTMVKVHTALPRFQVGRAKLTTWVFQIARNCAIDRLRKDRKRSPLKDEVLAELAQASGSFAPVTSGRLGMLHNILQVALSRLSETERDVLLMREVMEYSEIAAATRISEEAARARHKRALDRLSQIIRELVPNV